MSTNYEVKREHRANLEGDVEIARRLIGFAAVVDWDALEAAARSRGHRMGDVLHLPDLAVGDLPEGCA